MSAFDDNDLQFVLEKLEKAAVAAGGVGVKYQAAADLLRAYFEEHGKGRIEASALNHEAWAHGVRISFLNSKQSSSEGGVTNFIL